MKLENNIVYVWANDSIIKYERKIDGDIVLHIYPF